MARQEHFAQLDPAIIWFTHSRIRPFFSGCAQRVEDTLSQLLSGQVEVENIPFITVIENEGNYYSLNNRRLFVFKSLREAGKLPGNQITVRVKQPLDREKLKYTPSNCSLTATIMNEREGKAGATDPEHDEKQEDRHEPASATNLAPAPATATATAQVKSKPSISTLPKTILKEIKGLTTLVETGKVKKAKESIDKWLSSGVITPEQSQLIKTEIGMS